MLVVAAITGVYPATRVSPLQRHGAKPLPMAQTLPLREFTCKERPCALCPDRLDLDNSLRSHDDGTR